MKSHRVEKAVRLAGRVTVVLFGLPVFLSSAPSSDLFQFASMSVSAAHADGISYDSPHLSPGLRPGAGRQSRNRTAHDAASATAPDWDSPETYSPESAEALGVDSPTGSSGHVSTGASGRSSPMQLSAAGSKSGRTNYARGERREAALAHYARARTMLLESLAEFERAREIARPDLIIDSENWRETVVSRARELDKVLEPKGRESASGVRLSEQPSLVRETAAGGKSSVQHAPLSTITGPNMRREIPRARLSNQVKAPKPAPKAPQQALPKKADIEQSISAEVSTLVPTPLDELSDSTDSVAESGVGKLSAPTEALTLEPVADPLVQPDSEHNAVKNRGTPTAVNSERVAEEPVATVNTVNEAELRERLKKLAEEVQAKEKADQANVEPSNVGGMSR